MGDDSDRKHKRSRDHDVEHKKKKHKYSDDHKKRKHVREESAVHVLDDDPNDDDMWVEKNIDMDGDRPLATDIPTADSLKLTSHVSPSSPDANFPPALSTETPIKRDDWMLAPPSDITVPLDSGRSDSIQAPTGEESFTEDYGEGSENKRTVGGGVDWFSSLGTEVKRRNNQPNRADPDKLRVSARELNTQFKEGKTLDQYTTHSSSERKPTTPGGPGSQWRMMKLRRVYETAEEEGKNVEEVAVERFGSLEAFEEAREERRVLDERAERRSGRGQEGGRGREDRRESRGGGGRDGERRWMFTDVGGSGASSRSSSFRRPGGPDTPGPSTPSPAPPANRRFDSLRLPSQASTPLAKSHTPIPTVMTPPVNPRARGPPLDQEALNRMQAKVLRAKLMGSSEAEALEREYDEAKRSSEGSAGGEGGLRTRVEVLPTLDGQGRLYDVGLGRDDGVSQLPGNRKKKEYVETRDPKTGDVVRNNADDDTTTLGEMLRQEKFGAGMADQKSLDAELAGAIMRDGGFKDDLEYMDDNADKLGRKKMRSDAIKRQFAINDYKKTQKALATCQFCYGEDDSPPKAAVVAMGTRCYLACTLTQELVDGHCLIVPIQHHLTMLEGDDDVWDEVRNFMKCLMRMFAEEEKGVVFFETVINIKWQKHTYIECIPLPWNEFEEVPAYFKESILQSETEWTQHKKLINFSARPGGFRRAMVPNLPYFMVQFDHKGEKGYGHVIEGVGDAAGAGEEDGAVDEGDKGGGEFPRYFATEIIGNMLDIEPRRWRRPKRIDFRLNKERVDEFRKKYNKFDWTPMIGKS